MAASRTGFNCRCRISDHRSASVANRNRAWPPQEFRLPSHVDHARSASLMGTRRHWSALVLLVLWLSYYDHCAAPHSHCADSAGLCVALFQPTDSGAGADDYPCSTSCLDAEHGPMIPIATQAAPVPAPAAFALPEWMEFTIPALATSDRQILPPPPAEDASPPPLALLTLATPVRGPSL